VFIPTINPLERYLRMAEVFLVEDEVMIRMMVDDMLGELGHRVVGEAGQIDQALELAKHLDFDLAILDVNVAGKIITPVADLMKSMKRPFFFASGYGSTGIPPAYRGHAALQKPFQIERLSETIDRVLGRSRPAAGHTAPP
jgi:DNA-binding response OmpR family regulator